MQRPWCKNVLSIFEKLQGAVSGKIHEMEVIRDVLKEVTKNYHVGPCRPLQAFIVSLQVKIGMFWAE